MKIATMANNEFDKIKTVIEFLLFSIFFFSINSEWGKIFIGPFTILNVILFFGLLVVIPLTKSYGNVKLSKDVIVVFIFVFYIHLNSVYHTITPIYSYGRMMSFVEYFEILYFSLLLRNHRQVIKMLAVAVGVLILVGCIEAVLGRTFYAHEWQQGERYNELGLLTLGSTVSSANFMSLNILPIVPLLFYLKSTSNNKIVYYILISFWIGFIVFLYSRTGVVLLTLALLAIWFRRLITPKLISSCFYMLFVLLFLFSIYQIGGDALGISSVLEEDGSLNYRSLVLGLLITTFYQNPLFGVGYGSFKETSLDMAYKMGFDYSIDTSPMNTYLGTLAELGIIGAVLLFLLLKFFIFLTRKFLDTTEIFRYLFISLFLICLNCFMIDALFSHIMIIICALVSYSAKANSL